jgi:hypothetical protein
MATDGFTPARERARRVRIAEALRGGSMASPVWLLCPDASLRQELLAAVAARGGGFFRAVDWSMLAEGLDPRLGLPFAAPVDETERVLAVERTLFTRARGRDGLRESLAADPFGVASALLRVVDLLRAHGWRGEVPLVDARDPVSAVTAEHVDTLRALREALETQLSARGQLDLVGRLRRASAALAAGRRSGVTALIVEGVDRLDPTQRALLRGLRDTGCPVDVAPWVLGWEAAPPVDDDAPAPTLLAALESGARGAERERDESVIALRPRDVGEEAWFIARFIAERVAGGEAATDFAVSVQGGAAADRVRRALARWGLASCGASRVAVRATPLWQMVRAGVRLGWRGPHPVDLATVLAAPGAGVWGGDRDRLVAALRRAAPTAWKGVRDVVREVLTLDEAPDGEGLIPEDPARQRRLEEARERVGALVDVFERHGPFARHAAVDRATLLQGLVAEIRDRFIDSDRFSESVVDPRDQTAWLLAAKAIDGALRVELARLAERNAPLSAEDPSGFLAAAESLLGEVEEDLSPPRDEGVAVLDGHANARRRPRTLLVTGFVRGAHPSAAPSRLLLDVDERAAVNASLPAADALPTPDEDRALAWRQTLRLLALPTSQLVLLAPMRAPDGASTEPSLTWTELLDRMPPASRAAHLREGMAPAAAWLGAAMGPPRSARARRDDAVRALGRGDLAAARTLAQDALRGDPEARDFFVARLRPERRFEVGDLVRGRLSEVVFGARDLESAMTCRYRFLADSLLGLRAHRYARSADVGPAERTRAVRAALRRVDAYLAAEGRVTDDDVDLAIDHAVVPLGVSLARDEELRRATRAAVQRYLNVRRAWSLRDGDDAPEDDGPVEFDLALDDRRTVRARATAPRLERGDEGVMMVDFTLRALDGAARLRDLGLDVDAVLAPMAAATRGADAPHAYLRFSLARPVADAVAGRAATVVDEKVAPLETALTATAVRVERVRRLEDHRDRVLNELAAAFDDMDRDDAPYAPHDELEFERLHDGGARTCERCDVSLACRFRLAGGA